MNKAMTPHDELMALAGELKVAIAEAQHKPGEWHTSVQMMGAAVKREEPAVAGQFLPFNEVTIGTFPYKRDGWLAVKAVNALPAILALLDSDAFRAMVRDAGRWQHYASSPQTALVLGTKLNPHDPDVDWAAECNRIADTAIDAAAIGAGEG